MVLNIAWILTESGPRGGGLYTYKVWLHKPSRGWGCLGGGPHSFHEPIKNLLKPDENQLKPSYYRI